MQINVRRYCLLLHVACVDIRYQVLVLGLLGARNEERCGVCGVAAGCSASVRSACLQLMGPAETRNIERDNYINNDQARYSSERRLYYFRELVTDT